MQADGDVHGPRDHVSPTLKVMCFAARLGGVSGGKESQGWRDSSRVGEAAEGNGDVSRKTLVLPTDGRAARWVTDPTTFNEQ
jgi:hypothetical protein